MEQNQEPEEIPGPPSIRHCTDCGDKYPYDYKNKKGSTSNRCAPCSKRHAKEQTKREMLNAAGGGCVRCGYDLCLAAITFYDPVKRIVPVKDPKTREEKIEWASQRVALCLNCEREFEHRFIHLQMLDSKARPPRCFFYTDIADIVGRPEEKFALAPVDPSAPQYAEIEITHETPNITREVKGASGEKEKPPQSSPSQVS